MDINITRLPKTINPDVILHCEIKKKYGSKCPCCNSTKINPFTSQRTWYGKEYEYNYHKKWYEPLLHLFEKKMHWQIINFMCMNCNACWDSPPFPIFLNDEIIKNI